MRIILYFYAIICFSFNTKFTLAFFSFCTTAEKDDKNEEQCQIKLTTSIPVTWYKASASEQIHTVGSKALYRLNIENWRAKIVTSFRSAERYGGPLWAIIYEDENGYQHTLQFRKEGNAKLGIHPEFVKNIINDASVFVEHTLVPYDFNLIDTAIISNIGKKKISLWHYQVWDLYYEPIAQPGLDTLLRPIPGKQATKAFILRSLMKEDIKIFSQIEQIKKGIELKRYFPFVKEKAEIAKTNYFPADSEIWFSDADEIFDLMKSSKGKGSSANMRKEQLLSLLDPSYTYGPVWVGVKKLELDPGSKIQIQSWQKLNTKATVDRNIMENFPIKSLVPYSKRKDYLKLEDAKTKEIFNEMLTNAHQLKAFSSYDETTKKVITTQGSYYFDGFGLHTALRDFTNVISGLSYAIPDLAKSNLEYCFNMQNAKDGYLPYDWSGVHKINKLSGIRGDQPVALIWATTEYMNASGNWPWFFGEKISFYPKSSKNLPPHAKGYSPYEHVKAAFYYFKDTIGLGKNGLPLIHSSDWSDSLNSLAGKMTSAGFRNSVEYGESLMIGQMAVVVLKSLLYIFRYSPQTIEKYFEDDIKIYIKNMTSSLRKIFARNGFFFPRAILRDDNNNEYLALNDRIDVAGQVWALLDVEDDPVLTSTQRAAIIAEILAKNDSILGVRTVVAPPNAKADYFTLQSRPWSVIREWFAVALHKNGYTQLAWQHFWKTTLSHHNSLFMPICDSEKFNDKLLSGFDAWNLDGSAWNLRAIPMNNKRWNNANHNAMFLWAGFKLLGATPRIGPVAL